jgi:hypothetical protein
VSLALLCRRRPLVLALVRPIEERPDLLREVLRIAAAHRGVGVLLLAELAEQAAAGLLVRIGSGRRKLRDRVGLEVFGAVEAAQIADKLFLVARREQRRHENDVRYAGRDCGDGGVPRVHQYEIRADVFAYDPLQDRRLPMIGFDCEYERH